MTEPTAVDEAELAAQPHDRCQRCGRLTPVGIGLCDRCNPGHIGGPTTTQLHATILAGVGLGFVGLALLARLAIAGVGPFPAQLVSATMRADGGVDVTIAVHNGGSRTAAATCRVTRGGVSSADDIQFLTDQLAPGATATYSRQGPAPGPDDLPYRVDRLVARCT